MTWPIRVDPMRRHNDQIDAVPDCRVDDLLCPMSVNNLLIDAQIIRDKPLRKLPQALSCAVFDAIVEGLQLLKLNLNIFDGLDDLQ